MSETNNNTSSNDWIKALIGLVLLWLLLKLLSPIFGGLKVVFNAITYLFSAIIKIIVAIWTFVKIVFGFVFSKNIIWVILALVIIFAIFSSNDNSKRK